MLSKNIYTVVVNIKIIMRVMIRELFDEPEAARRMSIWKPRSVHRLILQWKGSARQQYTMTISQQLMAHIRATSAEETTYTP